jgi:hypothetical protein
MPSVSKAEQAAMAIAEHNPSKLYKRNRGLLKMSHGQLHDFASTPTKHLPGHINKKHAGAAHGFGKGPVA